MMPEYLPRVADAELADLMRAVGAVLIESPKACGKTATASRVAATKFEMDEDATTRHSGAGRFGVLRMRPMSLFESGYSTGEVSLEALLEGTAQSGRDNGTTVPGLMERIIIGGWPDLLDADEREARRWLSDYLKQIIEVDIPSFVGRRDPRTLERPGRCRLLL